MLIHFTKKALLALFAFLAGFVAQICHLLITQAMFWPVISATSIHFCLLIVSLGLESHRKWPRTFFCILVIYLSMSFIHQSLQILFKLVTTRQFMESDALVKFLGGNGLVNEFDIYLFMNWNILKWIISWTPGGGGTPL